MLFLISPVLTSGRLPVLTSDVFGADFGLYSGAAADGSRIVGTVPVRTARCGIGMA